MFSTNRHNWEELQAAVVTFNLDTTGIRRKKDLVTALNLLRGPELPVYSRKWQRQPHWLTNFFAEHIGFAPVPYIEREKLRSQLREYRNSYDRYWFPPGYTKHALLGKGTSGRVYKVTKEGAQNPIALKVISFASEMKEVGVATASITEASLLQHLQHPNLLSGTVQWVTGPKSIYLLIEQPLADMTLREWIGTGPSLVTRSDVLRGIVAGLHHLHSQGIMHGDVKPDNILMFGNRPCLGDYGLSEFLLGQEMTGTVVTVAWRPPEVFDRRQHTLEVDVWSLGMLLGDLFDCHQLETTMTMERYLKMVVRTPPSFPEITDPVLRTTIADLFRSCCRKYPQERVSLATINTLPFFPEAPAGTPLPSAGPLQGPGATSERYRWFVSLTRRMDLSTVTLGLALDLYDRYLEIGIEVPATRPACLSLAMMIGESGYIPLHYYVDGIPTKEIIAEQQRIVTTVNYQLVVANSWLHYCKDNSQRCKMLIRYAEGCLSPEQRAAYRRRDYAQLT